jgi:hypothetical protein
MVGSATECNQLLLQLLEIMPIAMLSLGAPTQGILSDLCSSRWHQTSFMRISVASDEDVFESTDVLTVGVDNHNAANESIIPE